MMPEPQSNASQEAQALQRQQEDQAWHDHAALAHSLPPGDGEGYPELQVLVTALGVEGRYQAGKQALCLQCM